VVPAAAEELATGGVVTVATRPPDSAAPARSKGSQKPAARRWWPAVTALALLAWERALLSPYGRHQWALLLFRQPRPYTVLAFNRPTALPTTAVMNEPVGISFTVANHEGHSVDYRYVLSVASGFSAGSRCAGSSGIRILGSSARTVPDGETWTVSTAVRPTCGISPCRLRSPCPGIGDNRLPGHADDRRAASWLGSRSW
jgi:hypothetical protein